MKRLAAVAVALMVVGGISALAADAKDNWTKHCAKCHGADGKGQGAMGKKLGVRDYTDAKVQDSLKDDEMIKATKEGVKDKDGKAKMKGFADALSDDEVKALVKYIREFKK